MFSRGYFSQGDQRYFIEPLSPTNQDAQEHALFKYDPEEKKANSTCGTDDILWVHGSRQNVVPPATSLVVCIFLFFICSALMYLVLVAPSSSLSSCD